MPYSILLKVHKWEISLKTNIKIMKSENNIYFTCIAIFASIIPCQKKFTTFFTSFLNLRTFDPVHFLKFYNDFFNYYHSAFQVVHKMFYNSQIYFIFMMFINQSFLRYENFAICTSIFPQMKHVKIPLFMHVSFSYKHLIYSIVLYINHT